MILEYENKINRQIYNYFLNKAFRIKVTNKCKTKSKNLEFKPLLMKNLSLNSKKYWWVSVLIKPWIVLESNTKKSIAPLNIPTNNKKNYLVNVVNSPKTSLQEQPSFSQHLNFPMMILTQYHTWKLKSLKLINTFNSLVSMNNCPNKRFKSLKLKWKGCIQWCNKINP